MVAKDENGKNKPVPGLKITSKQGMRRFARSVERKMAVYKRDSKYDSEEHDYEEFSKLIKGENVQLALN